MYDNTLDPDIRSLRQTIIYGLKGISAYGHQARELGYYSDEVDDFYLLGLEATTDDSLTVEELIRMTMRTGEMALAGMKKLDLWKSISAQGGCDNQKRSVYHCFRARLKRP